MTVMDRRRVLAAGLSGALATAAALPARLAAAEDGGDRRGHILTVGEMPSRHVAARPVSIYLPAGFAALGPLDVVYMQDGQNLFDPAQSYGGVAWGADKALQRVIDEGAVRPAMIVGPWNGALRSYEYLPPVLDSVPEGLREQAFAQQALSKAYVRFLTEELKPFIDALFGTNRGPESTAVIGSSMGGLISFTALAEAPGVFGTAAGLSLHSPLTVERAVLENPAELMVLADAFAAYLKENLPEPGRHTLYMDRGDQGLDALYAPLHARIEAAIEAKGYERGEDFFSRAFPGTDHNESAWAARLEEVFKTVMRPA
jgi:enterochelin esterase-like enzyme